MSCRASLRNDLSEVRAAASAPQGDETPDIPLRTVIHEGFHQYIDADSYGSPWSRKLECRHGVSKDVGLEDLNICYKECIDKPR